MLKWHGWLLLIGIGITVIGMCTDIEIRYKKGGQWPPFLYLILNTAISTSTVISNALDALSCLQHRPILQHQAGVLSVQ